MVVGLLVPVGRFLETRKTSWGDILHIILKVGLARRSSSLELLQANLLLIQMCGRMAVL